MKNIIIHAHAKNENYTSSTSINVEGKTKEQIKAIADEFFESITYSYRYEVEGDLDVELTAEEEDILDELELSIDF